MGLLAAIIDPKAEFRSGFANPAQWLIDALGAGPSASGISVTEANALKFSAVYASHRIIGETVGSLPFLVYKRGDDDGRHRAPEHSVYKVLHDQANPHMTAMVFRETLQGHILGWGNGYAEIARDGSGNVRELWPLDPSRIGPVLASDGSLEYVYKYQNGQNAKHIPAKDVLHIPGLGFDGYIGYSPIRMAREAIGLGLAAERHGATFFANDSRPGGVLEHPGVVEQEAHDRLKASWETLHSRGSAHRIAILEQGMKWQATAIPNEDAQWLESRAFQVREIARIYRIPPHLLADLDRATFCMPADTEVLTTGGPVSIADVNAGDVVCSFDETGQQRQATVLRSECTGEDEILCIRTTNRSVRMNARHRVAIRAKSPTPRPGAGGYQCVTWETVWRRAGELKVGDVLIAADGIESAGLERCPTRDVTEGFAEFCGLLLGDGNINKNHGVTIARAATAQYMDHYRDVMAAEFVSYDGGNGREVLTKTRPVHIGESDRQTRFSSVLAANELTELGLAGTAHTKSVPGWVFKLTDKLRLAFLRGFLDADGSVDKKGRISYSSCNEKMLSQIRHLCIAVGVPVTNMRCQEGVTTLPNGRQIAFRQYAFTCSDPGANRRIGSNDPRYVARMMAGKPINRKGRKYPRYGGKGFDAPGMALSRITSIDHDPVEKVYDLEVDGTHCFIANGVVVHNSNIEAQGIEFVTHCIRPWLVRWEQECNRKLLANAPGYFCEHVVDGLLRGDTASRYSAYAVGRQWGWLSTNEIRRRENMNPIDGGDEYLVPMNMTPAAKRAIIAAHRPLLTDICGRILRREAGAIESALRREATWKTEIEAFYSEHRQFIVRAIAPAITACLGALPATVRGDRSAGDYAWGFAETRVRRAMAKAADLVGAQQTARECRGGAAAAWADEILTELIGGENTDG